VSAPDILANMARGWNRDPAGVSLGSERTGVSAALWTHDKEDVQEATAEPHPDQHAVCIAYSRHFVELRLDGRRVQQKMARPGEFNIIAAGVRPWAVHRGRWRTLHLYVPGSLLHDLVAEEFATAPGSIELIDPRCTHDALIERIGCEVLTEMREGQPLSRLRVDALGQELAIHLLRAHSNVVGTRALASTTRGGLAPWQVKRVTEHLNENLAGDVSLASLSALVGLSTYHLCRAFKQSTGLPPHRWQVARRIERARELLESSDLPITEVAALVGYDDPTLLARLFRKAVGVSPSEYRRAHRA